MGDLCRSRYSEHLDSRLRWTRDCPGCFSVSPSSSPWCWRRERRSRRRSRRRGGVAWSGGKLGPVHRGRGKGKIDQKIRKGMEERQGTVDRRNRRKKNPKIIKTSRKVEIVKQRRKGKETRKRALGGGGGNCQRRRKKKSQKSSKKNGKSGNGGKQ